MTASRVTSPLVERLQHAIQHDADPEVRAMHAAELACYWARVGEFELAEEVRVILRRDFGRGDSIRVSILTMCVEAMVSYFRELSADARDRMVRAKLLSTMARDDRLIALTSAWLAHIEFNQNKFDEMTVSIRQCLSAIDSSDGPAACRVSLVLGDGFLYCRQREQSQIWYARAHAAATECGDHAAIGALTYNRAALDVANARLSAISQSLQSDYVRLLRAEVDSAINYQRMARLKSLDHLLSAASAGVNLLLGQFSQVVEITDQALGSGQVPVNSAEGLLLRADRALGLAGMGMLKQAGDAVDELEQVQLSELADDDRALTLHSIRATNQVLGRADGLNEYTQRINQGLEAHQALVARLTGLLSEFDPNLHHGIWERPAFAQRVASNAAGGGR